MEDKIIRAQNLLNLWIAEVHHNLKITRTQIKFILADKLQDMSMTDVYEEKNNERK